MKIAIDAGHGINTPGKRVPTSLGYGDIREWTLNNKVVVEIIKLLKQYKNVEILRLDDSTGKRDIPLSERTKKANNFNADLVISIHHNAGIGGGSGGGLVVYRYPNSSKFTKKMQRDLYDSLIKSAGLKGNRSTPLGEANFHMLRVPKAAAVLPELGFMDSKTDIKEMVKQDWGIKNARGIVNWLENHYKLKKKVKDVGKKEEKLREIKLNIHGKETKVEGIYKDFTNYVPIRLLEELGYDIDWKDGTVIVTYKGD